MSEQSKGWQSDEAAPLPAKPKSESQLRLVTADGAVVFPDDAEHSDEAPTIISKTPPAVGPPTVAVNKPTTPEMLLGSLRGRKLAHFELIEPIGVGGMAAVLRARDAQLDRFVALKILPPDMTNDDENIRRFHQEARAAAKLDHENIARVFYCGEDQKLHFIAFEYVEGDNLRTILQRRGQLPVAEAVRYVLQIATGLEHASSRGVVHRDVKPSNIIITPTGRAKLVDMGLARNMEPHTDQLTQSGMTLGTYDYLSPEQAIEPREADARSDIYSLGCTFYHMLTGQAPVPEGTAAKKLHHHQHVMPIDPRQLNPEIPDEVALILHKMMAKNPKDRYQRPVHLVQHLMQVAQKVGAAADLPEGALFIDTPLLAPPRKRPLLLVSIAALALAAVLLVLSLAPPHRTPSAGPRPSPAKDDSKLAKDGGPGPKPAPSGAQPIPTRGTLDIASQDDLIRLLADPSPTLTGIVTTGFEISDPNLVFQGGRKRMLILRGKSDDEGNAPIISWKWQPRDLGEPAVALLIEDGDAVLSNLRFRIDGGGDTPDQAAGAIAVRGRGDVSFTKCSFQQFNVANLQFVKNRERVPLASIVVLPSERNDAAAPRLKLDECSFDHARALSGGQAALGLHGPAEVNAKNCAFMAHGAQFHLRGEGQSKITLSHCNAFVVTGPVFRIDDQSSAHLKVDYSIFSSPEGIVSGHDPLHLIRQTDATTPKVAFQTWTRNCFDHLNAMWVWPTETGADHYVSTLDEFRKEITNFGGKDYTSNAVTDSVKIWKNPEPHKLSPREAFELNPTVKEVRTADGKGALGIERCSWGPMAPLFPLPDEPAVALNLKEHEKLVDPNLEVPPGGRTPPGVFANLSTALYAANPGDVILIKQSKNKNREMDVELTHLKRDNLDVTLRPYDDNHHPILTLDKTRESTAYFFRLLDGKMTFENLEIVLEPDQPGFRSQSLVMMDGNAAAVFRNCVITLKPNSSVNPTKSVPLSVVTLSEVDGEMMMMGTKPARTAPEISFENCFIRGEGEAVSNRAGRAMDLRLVNCVASLAGSLVTVQSGPKDATAETVVKLSLWRSSIFTTDSMLVAKQGKSMKSLPNCRIDRAASCLFVGLFAGDDDRPFIATEYPDIGPSLLRTFLDWRGAGNVYSGFDKMLEDANDYRMNTVDWKTTNYKEGDVRFVRANFKLARPPRDLWLSTPELFQPKAESQADLQGIGANLDNEQLPPLERSLKSEP